MEEVTSVRQFMSVIFKRSKEPDALTAYRGLSDSAYELVPSVFRKDVNREQEHILLRELIAAHPEEFEADHTTLEQLVRMQHYALPTRLLDVTFNPLVALFFAAQKDVKKKPVIVSGRRTTRAKSMPGDVVIFTVKRERVRYFDSDTVSCIANLAKLSWEQKQKIRTTKGKIAFNKDTEVKRLLHFIRHEKPHFESEIEPGHLDEIFLVKPKLSNKRIIAQNGAFFILGRTTQITEPDSPGIQVERLHVPVTAKKRILDELDKLNINEKTMFPEIERAARYFTNNLQDNLVASILSKP